MKLLLKIFIPLCVFSFIAYWISLAVLTPIHSQTEAVIGEAVFTDGGIVIDEEYGMISADVGSHKLVITPYSGSVTEVVSESGANVAAYVSGDTLNIELGGEWGIGNLFDWNNSQVQVLVPDRTYDKLDVEVSMGEAVIRNVAAYEVTLNVGAGSLDYTQPDIRTKYLGIEVSAGSAVLKNAATDSYDIAVSAGSLEVYGLTGTGSFDVSAGSAEVQLAQLDGRMSASVGAGSAVLDIPEDASAKIECGVSLGGVSVNACGVNKKCKDGETVTLNGGENEIGLEVSAGDISIVSSQLSAPHTEQTAATTATYANVIEYD